MMSEVVFALLWCRTSGMQGGCGQDSKWLAVTTSGLGIASDLSVWMVQQVRVCVSLSM